MLLPGAIAKAPFMFGSSVNREHPTTPLLPRDQLHYFNLVRRPWKEQHINFFLYHERHDIWNMARVIPENHEWDNSVCDLA
jgi:hypothetical protein